MDSLGSLFAFEIRFHISCMISMVSSFQDPDVSLAIGANMCVEVVTVYFVRLSCTTLLAAEPARINVSLRWDSANVSGIVTSQASGLPTLS